jgi:hypothetical protein
LSDISHLSDGLGQCSGVPPNLSLRSDTIWRLLFQKKNAASEHLHYGSFTSTGIEKSKIMNFKSFTSVCLPGIGLIQALSSVKHQRIRCKILYLPSLYLTTCEPTNVFHSGIESPLDSNKMNPSVIKRRRRLWRFEYTVLSITGLTCGPVHKKFMRLGSRNMDRLQ